MWYEFMTVYFEGPYTTDWTTLEVYLNVHFLHEKTNLLVIF